MEAQIKISMSRGKTEPTEEEANRLQIEEWSKNLEIEKRENQTSLDKTMIAVTTATLGFLVNLRTKGQIHDNIGLITI